LRDKYYRLNQGQRARLDWLLRNPSTWKGYRLNYRTLYCVFGMMQVAGLYSFTTHLYDTTLLRLIKRARKEVS
jgi:hypothetical protein